MSPSVDRARPGAPRLGVAAALIAALLAAMFVAVAPNAHAAATAKYEGGGRGMYVSGSTSSETFNGVFAGEMRMTISGGPTVVGYCIDIHTRISPGDGGLAEIPWDDSGIANLDKVAYILNTFTPDTGHPLVGDADEKAAGIQAAIWHLTDGFTLFPGNDAEVVANYETILAAADQAGEGSQEPDVSLAIVPGSVVAVSGQPAGPFAVDTTAESVSVSAAGARLVDDEGHSVTEVGAGDEFFVEYPGTNDEVTITASAEARVNAGRVFFREGKQRLILAQPATTTVTSTATASWEPAAVEPGALTITKVVEGSVDSSGNLLPDDLAFEVVVTGPESYSETVTLNAANRFEVTLEDLEPGDYTVTEIGPSPEPKTIIYSAEGGVVVVAEGQDAAVTITNTYYDGPAPRVDLGESCEAGIEGTLHNDDGDLSVTFTVTIDGEESDVLVEAGKSVTLEIPETARSVTVTAPGMEDASVTHDPDACYELGEPVFTLECAAEGSSIRVVLDDEGELSSTYELYVNGEQVGTFEGDIDTVVPVEENGSYEVEVRSGDTSVGSETFEVDCVSVEGLSYERQCDAYSITLGAGEDAALTSRYTVTVTIDGEPTTTTYEVEPGDEPIVVTDSVPEGAKVHVEVAEEAEGTLIDDEWTANCIVPPVDPPVDTPADPPVDEPDPTPEPPVVEPEVEGIDVEAGDDEVAERPRTGGIQLPRTGAELSGILSLAGMMLAMGVASSAFSRRRSD